MSNAREFAEKMWEHTAKSLLTAEEWMEESASFIAARDAELVKAAEEAALRRAFKIIGNLEYMRIATMYQIDWCRRKLEDLIPEGGHLERAIARARLEESEWWADRDGNQSIDSPGALRLAANRAAVEGGKP